MAKLLYHFTSLLALVGADGRAALTSRGGGDAMDFAAPGSILADGIKPSTSNQDAETYDHLFRSPLPPCVWLTANPDMRDCSSYREFRITVAIPGDGRLVRWREYFRQHAPGAIGRLRFSEAMRIEFDVFYVFFGKLPPERFKAVDAIP